MLKYQKYFIHKYKYEFNLLPFFYKKHLQVQVQEKNHQQQQQQYTTPKGRGPTYHPYHHHHQQHQYHEQM